MIIQRVLRHANVSTTATYYIKTTNSDMATAMGKLEQETAIQFLQDCDGTVKPRSGANPESVN